MSLSPFAEGPFFHLKVPRGRAHLQISFDQVRKPKQELGEHHVFRVHRVLDDGKLDPHLVDWLWTKSSKGMLVGDLIYLSQGKVRITAFDYEAGKAIKDVGYAEVTLTC